MEAYRNVASKILHGAAAQVAASRRSYFLLREITVKGINIGWYFVQTPGALPRQRIFECPFCHLQSLVNMVVNWTRCACVTCSRPDYPET